MGNIYILQIFRGIAAIFVLSAHASLFSNDQYLYGILSEGTSGVDFFFVLSGFIIYYIHNGDIGKKSRFIVYIKKRFIRIYPIYWVYTFIYVFLILIIYLFTGKSIAPYFSSFNDLIHSLILYPYNVSPLESPIIAPAWTLSYELMFYIIFGIAILIKPKYTLLLISLWVLFILAVFLQIFKTNNFILSGFIFNPINLEFLYGCLIAFATLNCRKIDRFGMPFVILGIIYLIISWTNGLYHFINFKSIKVVTYGISYSLIIFGAVLIFKNNEPRKNVAIGRITKMLIYLGDASYSIYLIHYTPIFLLSILIRKSNAFHAVPSFVTITLSIFVIIALSCISYTVVEKPLLLTLKQKFLSTTHCK